MPRSSYESALLGPVGQTTNGYSVDSNQWLGARFTLSETTQVTWVGGHIYGLYRDIFAAIVDIDPSTQMPTIAPFNIDFALAGTKFTPPSSSGDIRVPISVVLESGEYGLVFGSSYPGVFAFGATGAGG